MVAMIVRVTLIAIMTMMEIDDLDAESDDDYNDWGYMEEIKINNISNDKQYFWSPVSPRVMLLGLRKTPCKPTYTVKAIAFFPLDLTSTFAHKCTNMQAKVKVHLTLCSWFSFVFFFTFPIVFVIGLACVFTHAIGWYEVTLCMETMHSLYALFSVLCV